MRRLTGALAAASVSVLAGCGSSGTMLARPPSPAPPPTLPARAVPYLPSSIKPVTAASLAREAQVPALAGQLRAWGFEAGAERYFQGESRRLQLVDARTLRFSKAIGASAFVGFMRSHLNAFVGSFPQVQPFTGPGGRRGILVTGQECQCHLANPSLLTLLTRGGTVSWLEINGPGATRRRLTTLLARVP